MKIEVYEILNTFSRLSLPEQIADGSCDWIAEACDESGRPQSARTGTKRRFAYGHTEAEARANFAALAID